MNRILIFLFCVPVLLFAQKRTLIVDKIVTKDTLILKNMKVTSISADAGMVGASDQVLATQKAVRDYVNVMVAAGRVTLRNAKPSPLSTYISELVIDTLGIDSAWVWNFASYRLLQTGGATSLKIRWIRRSKDDILLQKNGFIPIEKSGSNWLLALADLDGGADALITSFEGDSALISKNIELVKVNNYPQPEMFLSPVDSGDVTTLSCVYSQKLLTVVSPNKILVDIEKMIFFPEIPTLKPVTKVISAFGVRQLNSLYGTDYDYRGINDVNYGFSAFAPEPPSPIYGPLVPDNYGGWLGNGTPSWVEFTTPIGVVIGNSIAEGHPGRHGRLHTPGGGYNLTRPDSTGQWSYHLDTLTKYNWYNQGIGSQTSIQVKARWARDVLGQTVSVGDGRPNKTIPRKADVVLIEIGINDLFSGIPVDTTKANLLWMANSCIANGITCYFNNIGVESAASPTQDAQITDINNWMSTVLPCLGVTVLDFNSWGRAPGSTDNVHPDPAKFIDDVHPSKAGYTQYFEEVIKPAKFPILTKILVSANYSGASPPSNLRKPSKIVLDGDTLNLSSPTWIFTVPVVSGMRFDSGIARLTILEPALAPGSPYTGVSHIEYTLTNNLGAGVDDYYSIDQREGSSITLPDIGELIAANPVLQSPLEDVKIPNPFTSGLDDTRLFEVIEQAGQQDLCFQTLYRTAHGIEFIRFKPIWDSSGVWVDKVPTNPTSPPVGLLYDVPDANTLKVITCGWVGYTLYGGGTYYVSRTPPYISTAYQEEFPNPIFQIWGTQAKIYSTSPATWNAGVKPVYIENTTGTTFDLDSGTGCKDINGNNAIFRFPTDLQKLRIWKNGVLLSRTGTLTTRDYSVNTSTNVLTLTNALISTDRLVIDK